jgi:NitT/TauT family transport system ATP-binding protein
MPVSDPAVPDPTVPDPAEPVLTLSIDAAHHGPRQVLGAFGLSLERGEVMAVCGPSGVGKSTLLRIVAGLHTGFTGHRHVAGRLAMVFQEPTLLPWRSALDNIRLPAGCSAENARARLAEVGLAGREDDSPAALSLGQQRRLALARAMAARPDLLLLDEPFVSLDPALVDGMMDLVAGLQARHGFAAMLVTHARAEADRLARRTLWLDGAPARPVQ